MFALSCDSTVQKQRGRGWLNGKSLPGVHKALVFHPLQKRVQSGEGNQPLSKTSKVLNQNKPVLFDDPVCSVTATELTNEEITQTIQGLTKREGRQPGEWDRNEDFVNNGGQEGPTHSWQVPLLQGI